VTLRPARQGEAEALACLHVAAWQDAHAAFAPAATKALTVARRLPTWQGYLADPTQHVLVVEHSGALAGLVCFGPASQPALGDQAEIKHLYVAASARHLGLGKALLHAALRQSAKRGFTKATLAVVQENAAARGFYNSCGGQETGTFSDAGPLWKSTNIIVEWDLP
jgi:ribosomal protein S18 acetylase RimI-like enzyme